MLKSGDLAPEFSLPSTESNESSSSLAELLKSGGCFVVFAKKTCPTCRFALPFLNRFPKGAPIPTVIVAQETVGGAREMQDELDLSGPVLADADPYSVSEAFGVRFVPSGFLLDGDGVVQLTFESFDRGALQQAYDQITSASGAETVLFQPSENVPAFRPG